MSNGKTQKGRNWVLIFIASILFTAGLAQILIAFFSFQSIGLWSIVIGVSGTTTSILASLSVIKNDPAWIMIDLILPG